MAPILVLSALLSLSVLLSVLVLVLSAVDASATGSVGVVDDVGDAGVGVADVGDGVADVEVGVVDGDVVGTAGVSAELPKLHVC